MRSGDSIQSIFRNSKWEIKPKLHRYPTKRWGHTSALLQNKIYIYGGKTGKLKEPLYELDCDTLESHIHEIQGFPESRESHSCSIIKEKLIIWGGCRHQKTFNDCLCLTIKDRHCFWSQIPQFPMIKQRESHATVVLKDKYILLYGGSNEDDLYDDFWVFNSDLEIWFQIKQVTNKMKKRLGCSLTVIKDKIYMFGGETEDEMYQNELYILNFSELDFINKDRVPELFCDKILPTSGIFPNGRSSHSAVSFENRYLIIIGGEGIDPNSKGDAKKSSALLNDVWCFDSERKVWQMIEVQNKNAFKPRSCFSANIYHNKIYVFGGLLSTETFKSSDELLTLTLTETKQKQFNVCNICKLHYRQPNQFQASQKLQNIRLPSKQFLEFNLSNLYKISRMIKNPFDAFCLIVQGYNRMKYQQIWIDVIEGKIILAKGLGINVSQQSFRDICFKYEFVDEIVSEDPKILEAMDYRVRQEPLKIFGFNIKNACSRLGHTYFIANRRENTLDLCLVQNETIFYTILNIIDNTVGINQEQSYEIIKNYMHRNNLNIFLLEDLTFTIAITDLQRISPTQSQMRVNGKGHIQIATPITQIGKRTLQNYCSGMYLKNPSFQLTINAVKVDFTNNIEQFKQNFFEPSFEHDLKTLRLRQSENTNNCNSVISIYRGCVRMGCFQYNKKPSRGSYVGNRIHIQGYIEVSLNYELNILRNKIQNYRIVESQLQRICEEFRESIRKRKNNMTAGELEQVSKGG